MQMSISQAVPVSTQTQSGDGAAAKGTEGKFGQTLVQTLNGAAAVNDQSQAGTGQTVQTAGAVSAAGGTALQSLLGGNLSAADLLTVVEELLSKLDSADADEQDKDSKATEADLTDALKQLDDLLALLGGLPLIPVTDKTEVSGDTEAIAGNATLENDSSLSAVSSANVTEQQVSLLASIQAQVSQIQTAAVSSNPETIVTLKADLQDALIDLRSFLQQSKNNSSSRDQLVIIGKQLDVIQKILNGKNTAASLDHTDTSPTVNGDAAESVRALQSTVTTNSHLHRMANKLLHVGMLSIVPSTEEQQILGDQMEEANVTADSTQVINGNQELQRQIQNAIKPVVQQPVPVQQFAEAMQGLVVKQFSLTKINGVSEARISLYPENLGQVDVRISVTNGVITAHFLTDTVTAKDMLDNQMAQLRSALQSQGLQVDRLEVSQTADQQTNLFQDRQGQSGRDQQAAKRNKSNDDSVGDINFSSDLEDIKVEQAVDRVMGLGRGIHTMA